MYQGDYIPGAPVNDEVRRNNNNLPGMGGIYNYVNMHVYHYGGNNPVKYVDPDGKTPWPYRAQFISFEQLVNERIALIRKQNRIATDTINIRPGNAPGSLSDMNDWLEKSNQASVISIEISLALTALERKAERYDIQTLINGGIFALNAISFGFSLSEGDAFGAVNALIGLGEAGEELINLFNDFWNDMGDILSKVDDFMVASGQATNFYQRMIAEDKRSAH